MKRFLLGVALSYAARASAMVMFSWEALRLTGKPGSAAALIVVSSVVQIAAGPVLGSMVDRVRPYRAVLFSELIALASFAAYLALSALGVEETFLLLVALSALNALAGSLSNPSFHALSQSLATVGAATLMASRTASAGAFGFVVGYALGGAALDYLDFENSLVVCAVVSLLTMVCMPRPAATFAPEPRAGSGRASLFEAWRYLVQSRGLRDAVVGFTMCYALFHVVGALLPPFGKLVLQLDASQFGLLRASWSVGALVGALALGVVIGSRQLSAQATYTVFASFGLVFLLFSRASSYPQALLLLGLVGAAFGVSRSVLDGLLIQLVEPHLMGRIRGGFNSLISAVGLLVSTAATAVLTEHIGIVFSAFGVTVLALSTLAAGRIHLRSGHASAAVAPPSE